MPDEPLTEAGRHLEHILSNPGSSTNRAHPWRPFILAIEALAASPSPDRDRLREAAQQLYDRLSRAAGGEFMQDDIEALGAALSSEETT